MKKIRNRGFIVALIIAVLIAAIGVFSLIYFLKKNDKPENENYIAIQEDVVWFEPQEASKIEESILSVENDSGVLSLQTSLDSPLAQMDVGEIFYIEGTEESFFGASYYGKITSKLESENAIAYTIDVPAMDEVFDELDIDFFQQLSYENLSDFELQEGVTISSANPQNVLQEADGDFVQLSSNKDINRLDVDYSIDNRTNSILISYNIDLLKYIQGNDGSGNANDSITVEKSKEIDVYYTDTGICYHLETCRCLFNSKHTITLYNAINQKELRACRICDPPVTDYFRDEWYKNSESLVLSGKTELKNLSIGIYSENGKTWTEKDGYDNLSIVTGGTFVSSAAINGNFSTTLDTKATTGKLGWVSMTGLKEKAFPLAFLKYDGSWSLKQGQNIYETRAPITIGVMIYTDIHGNISAGATMECVYSKPLSYSVDVFRDGSFLGLGQSDDAQNSTNNMGEINWSIKAEMQADVDFELLGCSCMLFVGNVNILELSLAKAGVEADGAFALNVTNHDQSLKAEGAVRLYSKFFSLDFNLDAEGLFLDTNWKSKAGPVFDITLWEWSGSFELPNDNEIAPPSAEEDSSNTDEEKTEGGETPHTHAWGRWITTTMATCTAKGEKKRICACGTKQIQTISATGHQSVIHHAKVDATCTTAGNTEYWECTDCGKYFSSANCTVEIVDKLSVSIAAAHAYGSNGCCTRCGHQQGSTIGLLYTLNEDQTSYSLSGIGTTSGAVVVGSLYYGLPVTRISVDAFANCDSLTSITIPEGVTSIGLRAFYHCDNLTSITIPASVTSIGAGAFSYCTGIIETENGVSYVDKWVIDCDTSATTVDLRADTVGIGDAAFEYCHKLISITIPASVTSIGSWVFYGCNSLTAVEFAANSQLASIGEMAFYYCDSLTSVYISDLAAWCNIEFGHMAANPLGSGANLYLNNNLMTMLEIPNTVTSIKKYTFSNCTSITSVTIPASVTSIGGWAFSGCTGLTSIAIPASVTNIDYSAFRGCTSLTTVKFGENSQLTSIGGWAFYGCTGLITVKFGENSQLTSIGDYAFGGCTSLISITIPASTMSIGEWAFRGCTSLIFITIPASVTSIGKYAFVDCTGLESITVESGNTVYHSAGNCLIETASGTLIRGCKNSVIPTDGSVTGIGYSAFSDCDSLPSITIPASVTNIDDRAFGGCTGLTTITIPASVTSIGKYAFGGCTGLESITVESGNTVYHSAGNCLIEMASGTLIFGCKNSVIPTDGSVTSIGELAFGGCTGLTTITIPASVTSIGKNVFEDCTGLESITVESGNTVHHSAGNCLIETASGTLIRGCKNSVIPTDGSVTSIGVAAFWGCNNLTTIMIPASVTSIGYGAFWGCNNLTTIMIPASVTSIDYSAFNYCYNLTTVYYGGSENDWMALLENIGSNNYALPNAICYYYSSNEPTVAGNWWYYDNDGKPAVWPAVEG